MLDVIEFFPTRQVALELFGFGIHWYGIMYLLAFVIAAYLLPHLQQYRNLNISKDEWSSIIAWAVVGVLVGGRLGYVFFYEPGYFLSHPQDIIAVWKGGMASHGGFIGVALALLWALRKRKKDLLAIADLAVVPAAIGLAFGRFGNFINLELYGTATALPWGITIPGLEGLYHPVQLYAVAKDLLIASICFWHLKYVKPVITGQTCALFFMLYGVLRFITEYFRFQSYPLIDLEIAQISRGQLFTIPVFLFGAFLWQWLWRRSKSA